MTVLVEECVWVLYQKPQADGAHFMLELKLLGISNASTAKFDVVR